MLIVLSTAKFKIDTSYITSTHVSSEEWIMIVFIECYRLKIKGGGIATVNVICHLVSRTLVFSLASTCNSLPLTINLKSFIIIIMIMIMIIIIIVIWIVVF